MTVDTMETVNRILDNITPTTSGVMWWKDTTVLPFTGFVNASNGLLKPTNPSGNTVRIASGVGVAQGWLYANDDNVDFDVSTGPATSTNYIVLRRDRAAQTVRLAYIVAAAPAGTAVPTQDATTWEVIIATVLLDGASALSVLTDSRTRVKTPGGSLVLIETLSPSGVSTVTSSQIPPLFTDLYIVIEAQSAGNSQQIGQVHMQANGLGGAVYNYVALKGVAATVSHSRNFAQTNIHVGYSNDTILGTDGFASSTVDIFNYAALTADASDVKTCHYKGGSAAAAQASIAETITGHGDITLGAGSTNIDNLTFLSLEGGSVAKNFTTGTTIKIYGRN